MPKLWEPNRVYSFLRWYVDWCTRCSYRHIRVEGYDGIPQDGAVILAPNHSNTLMDALLILQCDHAPSTYGARADIFSNPTIASILRWLRILPLARMRDGARAVSSNLERFDEIVDILDHDVPFCMFAEGAHHASHQVMRTGKGIWRIAFLAQERLDKPVYIVPMGLDHEFFFRSGGDVDIRFGQAISVSEMRDRDPLDLQSMLHDRIQELVRRPDRDYLSSEGEFVYYKAPSQRGWRLAGRIALGVLLLPFYVLWGLLSLPITVVSNLVTRQMKDKTWSNTVQFGCRLILIPLLAIIYGVLGFVLLPWCWALLILLELPYSSSAYQWHSNFYTDLINSLKK